jgi:hypothetical protein
LHPEQLPREPWRLGPAPGRTGPLPRLRYATFLLADFKFNETTTNFARTPLPTKRVPNRRLRTDVCVRAVCGVGREQESPQTGYGWQLQRRGGDAHNVRPFVETFWGLIDFSDADQHTAVSTPVEVMMQVMAGLEQHGLNDAASSKTIHAFQLTASSAHQAAAPPLASPAIVNRPKKNCKRMYEYLF